MKNEILKKYLTPTMVTIGFAEDVLTGSPVTDDGFDEDIFKDEA
jgi:hypothetical protein